MLGSGTCRHLSIRLNPFFRLPCSPRCHRTLPTSAPTFLCPCYRILHALHHPRGVWPRVTLERAVWSLKRMRAFVHSTLSTSTLRHLSLHLVYSVDRLFLLQRSVASMRPSMSLLLPTSTHADGCASSPVPATMPTPDLHPGRACRLPLNQ